MMRGAESSIETAESSGRDGTAPHVMAEGARPKQW